MPKPRTETNDAAPAADDRSAKIESLRARAEALVWDPDELRAFLRDLVDAIPS
jgi:hypothetical protein